MYWWFLIIIIVAVAYYGYSKYIINNKKKQALAPKCETCGSAMVLQTKVEENEIWECPKCNPDS